ncbi:heavy metal sensor histidine kinase [Bordetella bronchialis]|uniref:Sensor protein n=1 Tax=Bordetella bronchialis TaxID=463025 RepID=A0A193FS24_9BORD|nr:heavy metal sensor histidine kinase [Bordetella bronchialis]ANN69986.1 two-component sensor histidine kinase [Bordetella bronchialis]
MRGQWRRSLTLHTALLFALLAALVVSMAGMYLYKSMEASMIARSDAGLIGRVDRFRTLLRDTLTLDEIRARPALFENMLGNEQDVLVFRMPDAQAVMDINPSRQVLPAVTPVAGNRPLTPDDVHVASTAQGGGMRVVAAMTRTLDGQAVEVQAAHLLLNETRMLRVYRNQIALAVALAFVSIAVLGYLALRRGLRPLRAMASQAARITPTSLDQRLNLSDTPYELRELTASFNAMLDRLADGYQRLTQFSADLAHEIRTPIGALMGNCQVALYQRRAPAEYESVLASSLEELERLSRLVENILFLARADNAQSALDYTQLDLDAELRRVAEYFEGLAEERGIRLQCVCDAPGGLCADAILFRRALGNLVANAVRYADADSVVTLSAQALEDEIHVHVDNRGAPIPADRVHKLFDRFYRADVSRSAGSDASGLGLAIVRAIMALHGGSAGARSTEEGHIRFTLRYPARAEATASQAVPPQVVGPVNATRV